MLKNPNHSLSIEIDPSTDLIFSVAIFFAESQADSANE
jgi:hypothetical protein